MKTYDHYRILSELFRYPGEGFLQNLVEAEDALRQGEYYSELNEMQAFSEYVRSCTPDQREELYTKTFDVQPICYLDLGYVIFGEDYKRGAFLLHMQQEQQKIENDCGTELPDNICNMLRLFSLSEEQTLLDELAVKIMIPGLEKMIGEFSKARVDLKLQVLKKLHKAIIQEELNQGNVYRNLFSALLGVMKKDFSHVRIQALADIHEDMEYHRGFFRKSTVNTEVNNILNQQKIDQP